MQNKSKEVEEKTTQMWKIIYGLATLKPAQEDLFKETDKGKEGEEDKGGGRQPTDQHPGKPLSLLFLHFT